MGTSSGMACRTVAMLHYRPRAFRLHERRLQPALKKAPVDLTVMTKLNHGKFPDSHIVSMLEIGADMPSHVSAEMPVWGPILGKMNVSNPQDRLLRVSNLSRYLESIQVK